MGLTLTSLDTAYDEPDAATIARVLASLDGGRHVLATLARSEQTYLQAAGSVAGGFSLEMQEGALDRHHRCRQPALPLGQVTEIFQQYARGDESWRRGLEWEHVSYAPQRIPWYSTWVGYIAILAVLVILIWLWRGP